jgi:hypothetical protein
VSRTERIVDTIGGWADRVDQRRAGRGRGNAPGALAVAWATTKLILATPVAPIGFAITGWRAIVNHERAKRTMAMLPGLLVALEQGDAIPPDMGQVLRLDAGHPLVITSDLHRCVTGRLDLVGQQDNRDLYGALLDWYAEGGYGLVENGDVEDFWMVGGSAWGTVYDIFRLVGAALAGRPGDGIRQATYRAHLRRIVENHRGTYGRIAERFAATGRYHRTIGNHDDLFDDPRLVAELAQTVGSCSMASWILLDGPTGTEAIITHGHIADGWNAPGRATLGKVSSWMADIIRDAPIPLMPDDLPPPRLTRQLLSGRQRNGLLRVDPRFGASSTYDSLDEELLFDALGGAARVGPWLLMGHTHFPVIEPASDTGARWWRYANSGHGLGAGLVTALEWPGDETHPAPRLVAWCWADHPEWSELVSDLEPTTHVGDRPIVRIELVSSADGSYLEPLIDLRVTSRSPSTPADPER